MQIKFKSKKNISNFDLESSSLIRALIRAVLIGDVNFLNFLFFFQDFHEKRLHYYRARGYLSFFS